MEQDDTMHTMDLQAWLMNAYTTNRITREEMDRIQMQLFDLIGTAAQNIYGDRKNFIPEAAQQLMESVSYQIMYGMADLTEEEKMNRIKDTTVAELYEEGQKQLNKEFEEYRSVAMYLKEHHLKIENRAYTDTIEKGIPEFFEQYDSVKKAHEKPGDFDYPICLEAESVSGFLYVKEYLKNLLMEEKFCMMFEEEQIQKLLNGYSPMSQQLPVNLYELVLADVIGNLLLDEPTETVKSFEMDQEKQEQLGSCMNSMGLILMSQKIEDKMHCFLDENESVPGDSCKDYVIRTLGKMTYRYQQYAWNKTLESFFVIPEQQEAAAEQNVGRAERMDKRELQSLKDELYRCRCSHDKSVLVHSQVRNIDDLAEVLDECMYGEESKELFVMLDDEELAMLMLKALKPDSEDSSNLCSDSITWHMELMFAIQELDDERQAKINHLVGKLMS